MSEADSTKSNRPEILRNRRSKGRQALLSFPSTPFPHGIQFIFHDYDYKKFVSSVNVTEGGKSITSNVNLGLIPELSEAEPTGIESLELPFPRTLSDNQGIRINSFEREFITERVTSALASGAGGSFGELVGNFGGAAEAILAKVREGGAEFTKDPIGVITGAVGSAYKNLEPSKALAIGTYLARSVLPGDIARTAGAASQRVVNPQDTLGFTGVDLKQFQFSWDLFPSNKEDTEQIRKIVNFLKRKSLPSVEGVEGITGLEKAFLKYPSIVETNLLGVSEKHFVRFKRAMITNITVDYGGGGIVTIMKGGVPSSVTISISMQELSIHTAEDYPDDSQADNATSTTEQPGTGAEAGAGGGQ